MRFETVVLSLAAMLVCAQPAGAVLKHYNIHWTNISDFNVTNPTVDKYPNNGRQPGSNAIVDNGGANPVLKRLTLQIGSQNTVNAPGLSGFIFLARFSEEGPRKGANFTGTGSTSSTVAWGLVTGWTVTGGFWCHASPTFICNYASGKDLATVDPIFTSPFFDLGTWTFHGTGFTAVPFIWFIPPPANMSTGNASYALRGRLSAGLVPALPVLGVTLLGASLLFAGARMSRRR
jgi:hypothetical protein